MSWNCVACTLLNKNSDISCSLCGTPKPKNVETWRCGGCSVENVMTANMCEVCGTAKLGEIKWACELCTFENEMSVNKCIICDGAKPKDTQTVEVVPEVRYSRKKGNRNRNRNSRNNNEQEEKERREQLQRVEEQRLREEAQEEERKRVEAETMRLQQEEQRRLVLAERKRMQETDREQTKNKIQQDALKKQRDAEKINNSYLERTKRREQELQTQASNMQSYYSQQEELLKKEQQAATRKLEFEKMERERRAAFEKQYEEEQAQKLEEMKRTSQQKAQPKPTNTRQRVTYDAPIDENAPFEAENEFEEKILGLYIARERNVGPKLPKVRFTRGNKDNVYMLGQRRLILVELENEIFVQLGNKLHSFQPYIEKQERLESLRQSGLASGQNFILGGRFF